MVHASGGCFVVEDLAREAPRAAAFEISATGPIFGTRVLEPRGEAAERERAAIERFGAVPGNLHLPRGIRLRGARRPLRVRPEEARAEPIDGGLELRFWLPPGSYATVLVEELLTP
jgi:tRNA pseudouridine13 synthase